MSREVLSKRIRAIRPNGGVAERFPELPLAFEKLIFGHGSREGAKSGVLSTVKSLISIHVPGDLLGRLDPAATCLSTLVGTLGRAKVGPAKQGVGHHNDNESNARKVVPLGQHLRSEQYVCFYVGESHSGFYQAELS